MLVELREIVPVNSNVKVGHTLINHYLTLSHRKVTIRDAVKRILVHKIRPVAFQALLVVTLVAMWIIQIASVTFFGVWM